METAIADSTTRARPDRPTGVRGPQWVWYAAGFAALGYLAYGVQQLKPPTPGVVPEQLVPMLAPRHAAAPPPPPADLDLSVSLSKGGLDLGARRLPTDVYTAIGLVDAQGQPWLVQPGDRQDANCLPACGALKLRVELAGLPPGPVRVAVLVSPKPMDAGELVAWLPHADEHRGGNDLAVAFVKHAEEQPPLWLGARAYAVLRVDR